MVGDDLAGDEPVDVGARRADPADAQAAPGDLAQRADRDDPVARVERRDRRRDPDAEGRIGRQVLDDLEAELAAAAAASSRRRASGIVTPVGLWKVGTT